MYANQEIVTKADNVCHYAEVSEIKLALPKTRLEWALLLLSVVFTLLVPSSLLAGEAVILSSLFYYIAVAGVTASSMCLVSAVLKEWYPSVMHPVLLAAMLAVVIMNFASILCKENMLYSAAMDDHDAATIKVKIGLVFFYVNIGLIAMVIVILISNLRVRKAFYSLLKLPVSEVYAKQTSDVTNV
eukprot:Blabericola_migrator_1__1917@NODE_1521_length_4352_cov_38_816103_g1001_i0_p3_GENE_NODE_1521_length_4352_cov_38_816103_g1001_i0NODE_1521_length_4352_cov_38_816103_g1001_i0_p3_ORF_typecomplete_len186_score23_93Ceramidase/PF05875_12/0_26UPF0182/PF03699_13/8_4_NODE_1521_length_4352_cov_38_816103_g1001_i0266823